MSKQEDKKTKPSLQLVWWIKLGITNTETRGSFPVPVWKCSRLPGQVHKVAKLQWERRARKNKKKEITKQQGNKMTRKAIKLEEAKTRRAVDKQKDKDED